MTNEPNELKEIHRIRERIYEETKGMTPVERAKYANRDAQEMIKEYKLKVKYENRNLEHILE